MQNIQIAETSIREVMTLNLKKSFFFFLSFFAQKIVELINTITHILQDLHVSIILFYQQLNINSTKTKMLILQ